jgi:hypothetical protein
MRWPERFAALVGIATAFQGQSRSQGHKSRSHCSGHAGGRRRAIDRDARTQINRALRQAEIHRWCFASTIAVAGSRLTACDSPPS